MEDIINKLDEEIEAGFEKLAKLEHGSEEYEKLLKAIKTLEELKEQKQKTDSDLDRRERELLIEEEKAASELENKEADRKASRWEHTSAIIKTAIIGVFTVIGTIITVNAEQTQVISTKGVDLVSKAKNLIR